MNNKIELLSILEINGEEVEHSNFVFADIKSIKSNDFYSAGQSKYKPSKVFIVHKHEYIGQSIVRFENIEYFVFRTYELNNQTIELHCEVKTGG